MEPESTEGKILLSMPARISLLILCFAAVSALLLLADDNVSVKIKEWATLSANAHPHDTAIGPDDSLWYTGQHANVIGGVDVNTGNIQEYKLKTQDSGPHGLIADREGNIWFTANNKAYIGRLDPNTGGIAEYPMPNPAARDPHTLIFAPDGILWFTVQQGNFVGKLDPRTGKVALKQSPTPDSKPYDVRIDSKGDPWY
jgi:virginiamycin B lyase